MDALTHAVEAYLSRFYNTKQTRLLAENAVVTIFTHLERAYRDGTSLPTARRCCRPRSTQARRSRAQASAMCTPSRTRSAGFTAYPTALQMPCCFPRA